MIPTNKLKKLVLQHILKFINSPNIFDECSSELQQTTEIRINPLEIKELFYKEILPDLAYNNFGYDSEIIEKLKNLNTSSGIDWMEVDRATIDETVANLHREDPNEVLDEHIMFTDDDDDEESEGDVSVNQILAKYNIPGHVRASQEQPCMSQVSEQLFFFRESQLLNVFESDEENDPLANSSTVDTLQEQVDQDLFENIHSKPKSLIISASFDKIMPIRHNLKRKSSSLSDINSAIELDKDLLEHSVTKQRRLSTSNSEVEASTVEFNSVIQQHTEVQCDTEKAEQPALNLQNVTEKDDNEVLPLESNGTEKLTEEEIVAEIQKKLDAANFDQDIIQRILDENEEYLHLIVIPFRLPSDMNDDEPSPTKDLTANEPPKNPIQHENKEQEMSEVMKESQSAIINEEVKSVKKMPRSLKNVRQILNYESSQCSDSIIQEEPPNLLPLNDTIISGSHMDCIGEVQDFNSISSSTSHSNRSTSIQQEKLEETEEEKIQKVQALIDAAKDPDELERIIKENEEYIGHIVIPFTMPPDLSEPPTASNEKSKEEIIEELQKKLDNAAGDFDTLNKIIDENLDYIEYVKLPFDLSAMLREIESPKKVKQETKEVQKSVLKVKNEDNIPETNSLERTPSRVELSFLLTENVNLRNRKKHVATQQQKIDENIVINIIDSDDD